MSDEPIYLPTDLESRKEVSLDIYALVRAIDDRDGAAATLLLENYSDPMRKAQIILALLQHFSEVLDVLADERELTKDELLAKLIAHTVAST